MSKQTEAPARLRAAIVYWLKEHGDVEDTAGRAQTIVKDGVVEQYGVTPSNGTFTLAFRNLEAEGRITRQTVGGTRIRAVRLNDVGEYADPAEVEGEYTDPGTVAAVPSSRRSKSLDRIINEIEKLPLPEKLMLVGMIADGCAGEVDETYTRLRSILGNI